MLSKNLENNLNNAFKKARGQRHEFMTVEHLLLSMLDDRDALTLLRNCGANIDWLRDKLTTFIEDNTPLLDTNDSRETQATLGFQRVLQRAVFHVQSSGKKMVETQNVIVAMFGEADSYSVAMLHEEEVTRLDVVNYISHKISKVSDLDGGRTQTTSTSGNKPGSTLTLRPLSTEFREKTVGQQACVTQLASLIEQYFENPEIRHHAIMVGPHGIGKRELCYDIARNMRCPYIELDAQNILSCGENFFNWMCRRVNNELKSHQGRKLGIVFISRFESLISSSPRCETTLQSVLTLLNAERLFIDEQEEIQFKPLVILSVSADPSSVHIPDIPASINAAAPRQLTLHANNESHLRWLMNRDTPMLKRYETQLQKQFPASQLDSALETTLVSWSLDQNLGLAGVIRALDELLIQISINNISADTVKPADLEPILKKLEAA